MEYLPVNRKTINNFRQNNPELVVSDLREYLGLDEDQCELVRTVLLARGVGKWLKNRRDIIAHKKQLKHAIRAKLADITYFKDLRDKAEHKSKDWYIYMKHWQVAKAELKILAHERGVLKGICMSDRYVEWPRSTSRSVLKEMNTISCPD